MVDREKVIEHITDCVRIADCQINHNWVFVRTEILKDALALLKAQEPREPHYTKLEYIVNGMPVAINHPECPRCCDNGLVLWDAEIERGAAYCKRCGQAVKWND